MKLFKNFVLNGSYQILLVLMPIITAPYISRVLGTSGIGTYAFTSSIVSYFVLVAVLGTATYGNREIAYHQKNKQLRSDIFWGITFLSWITAGVSIIAFLLFINLNHDYQEIYLWQGLLILSSMFDISWYFIGMEKFIITVGRNFVFKVLTVISIFIFVRGQGDLPVYAAVIGVGNLLSSLSLWPYLRNEIYYPNFRKLRLKHHFRYTILLFIPTIATSIYVVANKTMLGIFASVKYAGFFNQSDTMIKMALSLVGTIGVVMLPRVASMHSEGDIVGIRQSILKTFNIGSGISFALFFGICGIALKFAPFFFGKPFVMVGIIMIIEAPVLIFMPWGNIFGTQYLLPLNRMRDYTTSVTIGAVLNIVMNLILIPLFGVIGAVIATVLAEFSVTAYQYLRIRSDFSFRELSRGIWKYFVSGLAMFAVVFWMNQILPMNAMQLLLQIIVGIAVYTLGNVLLKTMLYVEARRLIFE